MSGWTVGNAMSGSMNCAHCGKQADLSFRFCPQCGQSLFIDLSRQDLTGDLFLDVLNSVYNLIITPDLQQRDAYLHPVSKMLIHRRFEIEYELEVRHPIRKPFFSSPSGPIDAITMRINCRSSNALTGYATRVTEELIAKKEMIPFSPEQVENGIISFETQYDAEHIVKNVTKRMSDKTEERRMLFICYLQDDNKHMNHFLDEPLLQRWFDTILQTNTETTIESYRVYTRPNTGILSEEVLNDIVFGYCVRLSESLFPIAL